MPIEVIRPTAAANGKGRASHMVRPSSEMILKEGRNPDGQRVTVYSAMGICGTETTGIIDYTSEAKDVTCVRCSKRAEAALAEQPEVLLELESRIGPNPIEPEPVPVVAGSHGWDAAVPVLSSPEATEEPADDEEPSDDPAEEPTRQGTHRTAGRMRHGKIRYERSVARQKMKQQVAGMRS